VNESRQSVNVEPFGDAIVCACTHDAQSPGETGAELIALTTSSRNPYRMGHASAIRAECFLHSHEGERRLFAARRFPWIQG